MDTTGLAMEAGSRAVHTQSTKVSHVVVASDGKTLKLSIVMFLDSYMEMIRFFTTLILNADESTSM
jgi:hypothetical protein